MAGFLFQRGIMKAGLDSLQNGPNQPSTNIDPITGEIRKNDEENPFAHMTDEQKEEEAEKLFVLFEKLNATGVIKATFPEMK